MISRDSGGLVTTFTRQGSQVQSLYRPPLNTFPFKHLRALFIAPEKSWGQTGEELDSPPLPPCVTHVSSRTKEGLALAHADSGPPSISPPQHKDVQAMQMDFAIPDINMDGRAVLDVGCGDGSALASHQFARAKALDGLDVDSAAIARGRRKYPGLRLVRGVAECLPFEPHAYDVVMSRVALPYTEIRTALREINQVMTPNGHLFLTMHDWRHHAQFFWTAVKKGAVKYAIDHVYIVLASLIFVLSGRVPARPWNGLRETFQTEGSLRRELARAGFKDVGFSRTAKHWRVTAIKR